MRIITVILITFFLAACQNIVDRTADNTAAPATLPADKNTENTISHGKYKTPASNTAASNATLSENAQKLIQEPAAETVIGNLWPRFQAGLQLEDTTGQTRVQDSINWYLKNRKILEASQQRARYFLFFIMDELEKQDVPFDVALIPVIESQYNPFASGGQPVGLWQFMPATGRRFNLYQNSWYDGRKDPVESSKAVATYFRYLMNMFDNDILLSLAAYNSGEGTVQNAVNKNRRLGKPTDYWHLELPAVTRAYIPKMVALATIFRHPEKYQIELANIDDQSYFTSIKIPNTISLAQVAAALDIQVDELYLLNAGIKRHARPDRSQYLINIPANKTANVQALLANIPKQVWVNQQKHLISSGESLGGIARKYGVSTQQIKDWNHLKSDTIVTGKMLVIATPVLSATGTHTSLAETALNGQKAATKLHKVKSGESLWKIAQIYKVKVSALAQWNKKSIDSQLKIGENLLIYTNR